MPQQTAIPQTKLADLCQPHHIRRLSLFRSVLRDDFTPESDIDILVAFEPGKTPGWEIVHIQQELSQLLNGRTIDLRTPPELSRYIRDRVLAEASVSDLVAIWSLQLYFS
jgi:uncharacterized protein